MSDVETMTRSSRDPEELRARLERWLGTVLGPDSEPEVRDVQVPSSNGMSSETLLFEASWNEAGARREGAFVARVAPDPGDVPVFPTYDLALQFDVMRLVGERSDVPVPRTLWLETDDAALGAPFFVMERAEGRVPPDVMPYNLGSWLKEAELADQRRLQDESVRVLAAIHAIDIDDLDVSFLELDAPGDTALRRHVAHWRRYYDWMRDGRTYPVLEQAFAWLEDNWPEDEGPTVISWGDSRIGNMMYEDFTPSAVLDWEMAALGPPGIDLGWMVFLHAFFEFVASQLEMDGMPHFLRADDVLATYLEAGGRPVGDLAWYEMYAALRHGIVMARVHQRSVHFGEAEPPAEPDEAVMHGPVLRDMLAGTYWA